MSKCIKCGRELTSAEIPEFYNGMHEKCYKEQNCAEYPFKQGIYDYQKQIDQLKQQLTEKDKEIKKLNWQLKDKDFIIKNLNHSLSVAPNANAGQRARIDELTKIVKEKDKEINSLIVDYEKRISQEQELMSNMEHRLTEKQNTIDEINKEFVQSVKDWKILCAKKDKEIEEILSSKKHFKTCAENMSDVLKTINSVLPKPQENGLNYKKVADDVIALIKEKDKEIEKLKQQYTILENENGKLTTELIMDKYKKAQKEVSFGKQLAIQKLEKVKILLQNAVNYEGYTFVGIYDAVNKQIKELKGEKDVED